MENKTWVNSNSLKTWKEFLNKETVLNIPLPKRSKEDISFDGIEDGETDKVGFTEGRLENGYPYRMECAEYKGSKVISIFVSQVGLMGVTGEDLDAYLRDQEVYEVYDTEPQIYTYKDQRGNDFWRIDILLEKEGDIFSSSPISIEEFSYGNIASEYRLLLKDKKFFLKVYYNEDNSIVEYAICSQKEDFFKQKFDCYVLSVLEMQKLNTVLAIGKGGKDIINLLIDYFRWHELEDILKLFEEYSIQYSLREEM